MSGSVNGLTGGNAAADDATTYWAQLLHFYQPPWQSHEVLRKILDECYRPLVALLLDHPHARLAVNMNAVLTEMLLDHGADDVVTGLRMLAEREQIEFVGSGKYHPILPLIPEGLRRRSIQENAQANAQHFGPAGWRPRGFFPPEMAFDESLPAIVGETGHDWTIVSGVACPGDWPMEHVDSVAAGSGDLAVLFRDDVRSNRISFRETTAEQFVGDLTDWSPAGGGPAYVVTAMDAETYGHQLPGWEREFLAPTYEILSSRNFAGRTVKMVKPSDLLTLFPAGGRVRPLASSWSTSADEIGGGDPFPLWKSPNNEVHALQWRLVDVVIALTETALRLAGDEESRRYADLADRALQPALQSCQFWWASRRPMWEPILVYRGLALLEETSFHASRAIWKSAPNASQSAEANRLMAESADLRHQLEAALFGEEAH